MKKILSLFLAFLTVALCFCPMGLFAHAASEITVAPYSTGMENLQGATQLLICPKVAGNWTDDWGNELMNCTWSLAITNKTSGAVKTVTLRPSSIYPGNSWGIIRFLPCEASGSNRFVPEKNVIYGISVEIYDGSTLLYTGDGSSFEWSISEDPILPDEPEPDTTTASGEGWSLSGGVLAVTSQSVMGGASSSVDSYPWHAYRSHIKEVLLGDAVTSVGMRAFYSCSALAKVTFGVNTTTFYMDCIANDPSLKEVIFRCPATAIGQGIVYATNNIQTVVLTDQTFEEFKELAIKAAYNFEDYGGIRTGFDKAVYIFRKSISYTLDDGVLTLSGNEIDVGDASSSASDFAWFDQRASVKKVILGQGVVSVGAHVFDGYPALEEVRVSSGVRSLGAYVFANAPALSRILFEALPESIGNRFLDGSVNLSNAVLLDFTASELFAAASQGEGNLSEQGGQTPLERAKIYAVHDKGVWKEAGQLSSEGLAAMRADADKNGTVNIADVTLLLTYLSDDTAKWAGAFYDVTGLAGTNTNDVTSLLNYLATKCGHSLQSEEELAATCTESGHSAYAFCPICQTVFTNKTVYQASGHQAVVDKPVAVTCGSDGLTQGSHCSVCGEILVSQQVIPATGKHTLVEDGGLAPTCGKNGYTSGRFCSVCGYAASGHEIIPATGEHVAVVDQAVEATCLKGGLTSGSHCSVCGQVLSAQQTVEAKGHSFENDRCVYCGKADTALLSGKTAFFTGDSLCAASTFDKEHQWWGWAERIKRAYGLSSYVKSGADGASVSNCRGNNTIINQVNNNKNRSFDFVVLEGGTNDGWDSVSVGTVTAVSPSDAQPSDFDLATFAGGLENLFYHAKLYFAGAKIGYVFTHKMNSNTGSLRDMSAYLAMAKQICEKWDIPMLDVDESPDFAVRYFAGLSNLVPDGIHPSSEGYELLYPAIGRFMAEIALDDSYAIYTAEIETVSEGPEPYAPLPDKDGDPQGWIRWLKKDMGDTTPMLEAGYAYGIPYTADGGSHLASPWEFWGGHYQFDYIIDPKVADFRENVGTSSYAYVWEIWFKDRDVEEDYRHITTVPWSVYAPSGIYRIETYDQGMNDLFLEEGSNKNEYEIVIIIYDRSSGDMVAWKSDVINFTDSSVLFMQDALNAGAIG